ncbi:MAG: hypothetical protein K0R50_1560 [Eubacterium sp.]|jgi:cell division protein FtsB|nr:hypothetical protein [Eubacterium sp.]
MKKFIIVIIFVFLIAILISFNYLLWDREKQLENFKDLSNAKNLSIDTLGEKIDNLDKLNKELNARIDTLTSENTDMKDNISSLNNENQQIKLEIASKNQLIEMLKSNLNMEPFESVIKKWVDAVNSKNYQSAIALISKNSKDEILNNEENLKSTCQSEIKAIRLKSTKLFTEIADEEHLSKIQFKVILEVDKPEVTDQNKENVTDLLYKSGENEKYITMEFDAGAKEWRVLELSDKP